MMFDFTKYSFLDKKDLAVCCFGGNAKSICVLTESDEGGSGVSPLLHKILAAVHLDVERDVLFYNIPQDASLILSDIWSENVVSYILIFGIQPQRLGLNFTLHPYQPLSFQAKTFVWCHDLTTLENGQQAKQLKMELWQCLKKVFLP